MVGRTLGRYRILDELGSGGMGVVYRAHDDRLHRDVALKVLAPDTFADQAARRRFRKEALALSALSHPNVATVYDFDSEGETDFLVMEYIPGTTLSRRLASGSLPERDVAALGAQIASALEEAHDKGMVHRDLKPGNIMLTPKGQVKVLDFGLAKFRRPEVEAGSTRSSTETRGVVGTLPYMAPEQLTGGTADSRTDIHALGVVLYEMSIGRRPYGGDTAPMLTDAILHQAPVTPRSLNPALSSWLESIILKCLEKDPENRYQSTRELVVDLRRASTGTQASAASTKPVAALGKRKRRRLLIHAAAALVVLVATAWWYFGPTAALTEKDVILLADFENRTRDPLFDGTVLKEALAFKLAESPFLNLYPAEEVREALRLMERPVDSRIDERLGREICIRQGLKALVMGSIASLGRTYVIQLKAVEAQSSGILASEQVEAESKDEVVRQLGKGAAGLRTTLGESLASIQKYDVPLEQATTSSLEALQAFSIGAQLDDKGQFGEALAHYKRATEIDKDFAVAHVQLADAYGNDNQFGQMREAATRAFRLRHRTSQRERLSIEVTYYASVTEDMRRAVEVGELQTQLYPRDSSAHNNLGLYYRTLGRYEEAAAAFREVIRLSPRSAGRGYGNLAWTYQFLSQFNKADDYGHQALRAGYDSVGVRQLLYVLAAVRGDASTMAEQVQSLAGKPQEYLAWRWQGDRAASLGQAANARGYYANAAQAAEGRGLTNRVAIDLAWATAIDARLGFCRDVSTPVHRALSLSREVSVLRDAAEALAQCGQLDRAEALVQELARSRPQSTYVNEMLRPDLLALIQIRRGNHRRAIELLNTLTRYNRTAFGMRAMYRRGLAYLGLADGQAATTEFQAILDNRGLDALSIDYPLARLQLGRAAALTGDLQLARRSYEAFFALWKDADPDVPIVADARTGYARVQ